MIPNVETLLIAELERRITAAMPETAAAPNDGDGELTPETFVTFFDSRKATRNVQVQSDKTIYCSVEAEIHVVFYSQKLRNDFSALIADFAHDPFIRLAEGVAARVEMNECETVEEGPYLRCDVW